MPQTSRILKIELHDFWHVGNGEGMGSGLDSVVRRNRWSLPVLPGRELKGIIKDSARCLESWGHIPEGTVDRLFGGNDRDGEIRVSNAELDKNDSHILMHSKYAEVRSALFSDLFSTAIDQKSGNAKHKSLRGMEVVIPCVLEAEITCDVNSKGSFELIERFLPLTRAVGSNRNRGLGRCTMTFNNEE